MLKLKRLSAVLMATLITAGAYSAPVAISNNVPMPLVAEAAEGHVLLTLNVLDNDTKEYVSGAVVSLYSSDNECIDTWTTGTTGHVIRNVAGGDYTIHFDSVPDDYHPLQDAVISIDGTKATASYSVFIVQKYWTINIQDINGDFLPNISVALLNANGSVVDKWITGSEGHKTRVTKYGTYYLRILTDAYKTSSDIEVVFDQGIVSSTVNLDVDPASTCYTFKYTDANNPNVYIAGATISLYDSSGNLYDSWVTTNEAQTLKDIIPGNYTIKVKDASGYYSQETFKITVRTGKSGTIVIPATASSLSINIKDITDDNSVAGCEFSLIDVSTGQVVDKWITTNEAHVIKNLLAGDYILHMISPATGYNLREDYAFTYSGKGYSTTAYIDKRSEENTAVRIVADAGASVSVYCQVGSNGKLSYMSTLTSDGSTIVLLDGDGQYIFVDENKGTASVVNIVNGVASGEADLTGDKVDIKLNIRTPENKEIIKTVDISNSSIETMLDIYFRTTVFQNFGEKTITNIPIDTTDLTYRTAYYPIEITANGLNVPSKTVTGNIIISQGSARLISSETPNGDVNNDGSFNIADAVLLQKYLLGKEELTAQQVKNADVLTDGIADVFDMVRVRQMLIASLS